MILFVSISFTTCLKFKKFLLEKLNFQKKMQKKVFNFVSISKRDDVLFAKKNKKLENECLIHFFQKYFEILNKNGEEKMILFGIKGRC